MMHAKTENYYHTQIELMSRYGIYQSAPSPNDHSHSITLSIDYYKKTGILNKARPLLPNKNKASHVWDNLELLGIKFPRAPIEYEPDHGKRYLIKKLYIMDWVQLDKEDPDQNDMWSLYLPPRVSQLI